MSIEAAIHELWSSYFPLTSLVPSAHVWTGDIPEKDDAGNPIDPLTSMPYVSLFLSKQSTTRTNLSIISRGIVKVMVYAQTRPKVKTIFDEMLSRFQVCGSISWSGGSLLDMKPSEESYIEDEETVTWMGERDYRFIMSEPR